VNKSLLDTDILSEIGMADTMIAAIALEHGLKLVTGNTSDFQRVQNLRYPLTLANWRQ
jgi:predicted nucleic acid-binding protein